MGRFASRESYESGDAGIRIDPSSLIEDRAEELLDIDFLDYDDAFGDEDMGEGDYVET